MSDSSLSESLPFLRRSHSFCRKSRRQIIPKIPRNSSINYIEDLLLSKFGNPFRYRGKSLNLNLEVPQMFCEFNLKIFKTQFHIPKKVTFKFKNQREKNIVFKNEDNDSYYCNWSFKNFVSSKKHSVRKLHPRKYLSIHIESMNLSDLSKKSSTISLNHQQIIDIILLHRQYEFKLESKDPKNRNDLDCILSIKIDGEEGSDMQNANSYFCHQCKYEFIGISSETFHNHSILWHLPFENNEMLVILFKILSQRNKDIEKRKSLPVRRKSTKAKSSQVLRRKKAHRTSRYLLHILKNCIIISFH
ncbi:MAG: hypothetical protein MHMPM18_002667 [Marteilia pararefringens]